MAAREYRKLAGRGRKKGEFFTWHTLWLGADHLLQVEHTGYSEEYRRFYFKDIQSITFIKTHRARNWTLLFLALIAVGGTLGLTFVLGGVGLSQEWLIAFGAWVFLLLILIGINLWKGPGCSCFVRTAVQQEQMPSFKRIKKSQRILTEIRQYIQPAQGLLSAAEVQAHLGGATLPKSGESVEHREAPTPDESSA